MAQHVIKVLSAFVLLGFFIAGPAFAQDPPMLYKKIQLSQKTYTFDEVTHEIQKQTGITFSYNASKINPHQHFRIKPEQMTVSRLLSFIKKRSGIDFKIINSNYIIYVPPVLTKTSSHLKKKGKKAKEKPKKKTRSISQPPIQVAEIPQPSSDSVHESVVVIGDSLTVSNYYSQGGSEGIGSKNNRNGNSFDIVMRYPRTDKQAIEDAYASLNPPEKRIFFNLLPWNPPDISVFIDDNFLIAGGFSANETHYFNPGVHFGFRFLYACLSYNLGAYSQWRYGLGMEIPISEKWFLQAEVNIGKELFKDYTYPIFDTTFFPAPDSLPPIIVQKNIPLNVVSKLSSFSLSVGTHLNQNILLSGGLTLNRLKSSYFSNGLPLDINTLNSDVSDGTILYQTIKPPYILSQSYNPSDASGIKYWLGLRLSLYWQFN